MAAIKEARKSGRSRHTMAQRPPGRTRPFDEDALKQDVKALHESDPTAFRRLVHAAIEEEMRLTGTDGLAMHIWSTCTEMAQTDDGPAVEMAYEKIRRAAGLSAEWGECETAPQATDSAPVADQWESVFAEPMESPDFAGIIAEWVDGEPTRLESLYDYMVGNRGGDEAYRDGMVRAAALLGRGAGPVAIMAEAVRQNARECLESALDQSEKLWRGLHPDLAKDDGEDAPAGSDAPAAGKAVTLRRQ